MLRRLFAVLKPAAACLMAGVLIWHFVEWAGPESGEVVVHVTKFPAEVAIDGQVTRVRAWHDSPLVRRLKFGRHRLELRVGGRLVYAEDFTTRRGESPVLTAHPRA